MTLGVPDCWLTAQSQYLSLLSGISGDRPHVLWDPGDPLQERGGDDLTFLSFICALNYVRWDRTIILDLGAGAGGSQIKG